MARRRGRRGRKSDPDTMRLRWEVHKMMDRHFPRVDGEKKSAYNKRVYARLRRLVEVPKTRCHVSLFSKADCIRAIEALKKDNRVPPPCGLGSHVVLPCGCFAHTDFLSHRCRQSTCLLFTKEKQP